MKLLWWRIPALMLILVATSCSERGGSDEENATSAAQPEASVSGGTESSSAMPPTERVKDLGVLVDLIVTEAGELPKAEFDPATLANSLGKDPKPIFEWVRDRTWWAPYRGLLRGARGVMLDRVGSSLDRAVLLGDLLRRAGHTVRLAHAQLPEARASELLSELRPIPDQRRNPIQPFQVSAARQRAIESVMPGLERVALEQIAASRKRRDEAEALARSQAGELYYAVREVAARNAEDDRAAIAALQDHWWVERQQDGKWIAMDVLLPNARLGDAIAAASATSEWKKEDDAPSIPDADWHTVQIRVVVERYQNGVVTEATALETELRPASTLERPITLIHRAMPWPDEIPDPQADPNALKNAALWVNKWVPFLRVGDDFIAQSAFTDSGELTSISTDSAAGLGSSARGGLDFFGSSLGGGEDAESYATAEWIDYEIRVPGELNQRLRRPVFDLLGPAKRSTHAADFEANSDSLKLERFEALSGRTDILLQPSNFTNEFVAHVRSNSIVANQAAIKELSQERDLAKARSLASTILQRIDIWGPLPNLALWRSSLGVQTRDSFIDRPNVLNYRVSRSVASADRPVLRELIDIASNATGVRRGASRGSFEVRLHQGVIDTVAEMLTLGTDPRMAENTASVFAQATERPDRGVLIGPGNVEAVRRLGWPEDVAARLAETIDAGFVAVALKEPVSIRERQRLGWWRVDPKSGETIGVMDTGFHADDAEYAAIQNQRKQIAEWLFERNNQRQYDTLQRMARENPTQMTAQDMFDYNFYRLVSKFVEEVAWLGL